MVTTTEDEGHIGKAAIDSGVPATARAGTRTSEPIWNIVTKGQKGKDVVDIGGPGVVTHMVDEAGTSSFLVSPR